MTQRSYDHHDIGSMRDELIKIRDERLKCADFTQAVLFSHIIAVLYQYDKDIIANNLEGDPHEDRAGLGQG